MIQLQINLQALELCENQKLCIVVLDKSSNQIF